MNYTEYAVPDENRSLVGAGALVGLAEQLGVPLDMVLEYRSRDALADLLEMRDRGALAAARGSGSDSDDPEGDRIHRERAEAVKGVTARRLKAQTVAAVRSARTGAGHADPEGEMIGQERRRLARQMTDLRMDDEAANAGVYNLTR